MTVILDFTPETSVYARDLASSTRGYRFGGMFTADEKQVRDGIVVEYTDAYFRAKSQEPDVVSRLLTKVVPVWAAQCVHGEGEEQGLRGWGKDYLYDVFWVQSVGRDFFNWFNDVLTQMYGTPADVVWRWVERMDAGFRLYGYHLYFLTSNWYEGTYPVEWFGEVNRLRRTEAYDGHVIAALNKGFTPEMMSRTDPLTWSKLSVSFIKEYLTDNQDVRVLNQLVKLGDRGNTRMDDGVMGSLLDAGFRTSKEVKDYARKFGVGFTASNFYSRVAAAKTLHPVLEDYIPVV